LSTSSRSAYPSWPARVPLLAEQQLTKPGGIWPVPDHLAAQDGDAAPLNRCGDQRRSHNQGIDEDVALGSLEDTLTGNPSAANRETQARIQEIKEPPAGFAKKRL